MSPAAVTTSIRLSQDILDRADALTTRLTGLASSSASGALARSDVLRMALVRGLDQLELEQATAPGKPTKPTKKR
jgi:hypothetical protein